MAFHFTDRSRFFTVTVLHTFVFRSLMLRVLLIISVTFILTENVFTQGLSDSPQRVLSNAFEKGNLMVALSDHQWRPGLNLAAAHLAIGGTVSLNVSLEEGVEYVFVASGPYEQADVDLYLRDSTGTILARDQQEDGTPVVEFRAPANGAYQLQLHLVAANEEMAYVALSLLCRRGRQIPEQDYHKVATGFFAAAHKVRASVPGIDWQKQPGEWCLFGYSLRENEGATLRKLQHPEGQKIIAAAAGPEPAEISLYLGTDDGQIVAKTQQATAYPLLDYSNPAVSDLDLRLDVERARAHILVLVGVFQ
ncbi:hypothetical protein FUA23_19725 [Neolewinella aurantiaca]|uniref:Uncharacterized protein n=1 Tax=Neolewinella aurantiaca TaxID=2602767 RepID=A0A5C7F889_9BACT|nr:PPC domain-containing protein [Neolewinella aurantiaca]TXF86273.1 hypothetical protein FUA23_19725 [Neolewinella aurantiaca]